MVLVGILLNRSDANRLDARITALEGSVRGQMSALEGSLRGELTAIRNDMNSMKSQFHSDILMIVRSQNEQDIRIAKLEENE